MQTTYRCKFASAAGSNSSADSICFSPTARPSFAACPGCASASVTIAISSYSARARACALACALACARACAGLCLSLASCPRFDLTCRWCVRGVCVQGEMPQLGPDEFVITSPEVSGRKS